MMFFVLFASLAPSVLGARSDPLLLSILYPHLTPLLSPLHFPQIHSSWRYCPSIWLGDVPSLFTGIRALPLRLPFYPLALDDADPDYQVSSFTFYFLSIHLFGCLSPYLSAHLTVPPLASPSPLCSSSSLAQDELNLHRKTSEQLSLDSRQDLSSIFSQRPRVSIRRYILTYRTNIWIQCLHVVASNPSIPWTYVARTPCLSIFSTQSYAPSASTLFVHSPPLTRSVDNDILNIFNRRSVPPVPRVLHSHPPWSFLQGTGPRVSLEKSACSQVCQH